MISRIARVVISTWTAAKASLADAWATRRTKDTQSQSKSNSTESATSETFTTTGTTEKTPLAVSKREQLIFDNKSSPSVIYDLTDHQGPRVTMSGQRAIVEYMNDPSRDFIARREASGGWSIEYYNRSASFPAGSLREPLEQLYHKYLNEIMTREFA